MTSPSTRTLLPLCAILAIACGRDSTPTTTTGGSAGAGTGGTSTARCDDPGLVWHTANKTNYTSYPDPGSPECIQYNGCTWAGQFAACPGTKLESWVASHDIVALFPLGTYADHDGGEFPTARSSGRTWG